MGSTTFLPIFRLRGRAALRLAAVAAMLGAAAACGTPAPATPQPAAVKPHESRIITAATLKPGQAVPQPAAKPVLTLTGKISTTNRRGTLVFDQPTLAKLGVEQVRLYEPWAKQDLEFRGVWVKDLLAVAGVKANATRLHITALDDYQVDLNIADIRAGGIMLATSAGDGSAMPVDKGGPTRIVFMNGVKAGANADQWIWSLKTIDVQ